VVRLHPSSTDASKEIIPEGAAQSHAHEALHEAIVAADVVITLTSTVGMESLFLDKPLLVIAISPYQRFADYSEEDGALVVKSLEEAEYGIATLLSDAPITRTLQTNRRKLPKTGDSAGKVCDVLENLNNTDALSKYL
jgi:hypothetical protein